MGKIILVPIHLDALFLESDQLVAEASADFSRLPYIDSVLKQEINFDMANISEEIISLPFQSQNMNLKRGIHLHWALPDALTRGVQHVEGTAFPSAPNRWLIRRSWEGQLEKQWVVESDYLYPVDADASGEVGRRHHLAAISYYHREPGQNKPYRYMGRSLPLDIWLKDQIAQENGSPVDYLPSELTAVGYGVPTFAAFYPNSYSVFGFHDSEIGTRVAANSLAQLSYELVGWYSHPERDHIRTFVQNSSREYEERFRRDNDDQEPSEAQTLEAVQQAINHQLKWEIDSSFESLSELEELQTVLFASLRFEPAAGAYNTQNKQRNVVITVGNSRSEAMSTYIAHQLRKKLELGGDELHEQQMALGKLEDQLESLYLSGVLEDRELDIGPRFSEARHASGFASLSTGSAWKIRLEALGRADADQSQTVSAVAPSAEISASLDHLNHLQREWDKLQLEIETRRRQLFADWYKYMLCVYHPEDANRGDDYPDVDEVRHYIATKDIKPLTQVIERANRIETRLDESIELLKTQLAAYDNELVTSTTVEKPRVAHHLEKNAAARYWQPNEPVILITGDGVRATKRHMQDGRLSKDGLLQCRPFSVSAGTLDRLMQDHETRIEILDQIIGLKQSDAESIAYRTWKRQPWNPILLEWELELMPAQSDTNLSGAGYAENVITQNYSLANNESDLKVNPNRNAIGRGSLYSNRCILTPDASDQLKQRIEAYLEQYLFEDYLEYQVAQNGEVSSNEELIAWYTKPGEADPQQRVPVFGSENERFDENGRLKIEDIKKWYEIGPFFPDSDAPDYYAILANDPIYIAILAYEELFQVDGQPKTFLSQSLGGFNEELLMRKQTMQLPVEDPLGIKEYREFTREVQEILQKSVRTAPEPLNQFNPIRTGAINITRLRLIDTFGQVLDFNHEEILIQGREILTPQRLTAPGSHHLIWLPPRLAQPARVDFRFLAASEQTREMGSFSDTTPICGWVLPNNIEGSLMIYDNSGEALGSIVQRYRGIHWQPAPGRNREVDEIPNPHLQQMVQHILSKNPNSAVDTQGNETSTATNFLEDFITTINIALETISPESFAQHQSMALLTGRPIAVVRASLNLELAGPPAIHQGWHAFRLDMNRSTRETDNFTRVRFPIRVGEYQQLNDGVVGYWKETVAGYKHGKFYAPQTASTDKSIDHPDIVLHEANSRANVHFNILQSVASPPQKLTILMDPRGVINCTSGILPTKVIRIPNEQFAPALEAIQITLLTTQLLTATQQRSVPLPLEPGFTWSWLEPRGWIEKQLFVEVLGRKNATVIWNHLLDRNWLKTQDAQANRAKIVPMERRGESSKLELITKDLLLDRLDATGAENGGKALLQEMIDQSWLAIDDEDNDIVRIVQPETRGELKVDWATKEAVSRILSETRAAFEDYIERVLWSEIRPVPTIEKQQFLDQIVTYLTYRLWTHLLSETVGWLKWSEESGVALVVPANERVSVRLSDEFMALESVLNVSLVIPNIDWATFADSFAAAFRPLGEEIWRSLQADGLGWLARVENSPTRVEILPKRRRTIDTFEGTIFDGLHSAVEAGLSLGQIRLLPVSSEGIMSGQQEVREGWLVLSRNDE